MHDEILGNIEGARNPDDPNQAIGSLIAATVHKQFSLNWNKLETLEKVRNETTYKVSY